MSPHFRAFFMRRFALVLVAIATLVVLASSVRIQPSGFARVIGSRVLFGRVGIAPPWPRESCLLPVLNNQLYIRRAVDLTAADGSPFRANVTFVTSQAVDCRTITSLISEGKQGRNYGDVPMKTLYRAISKINLGAVPKPYA